MNNKKLYTYFNNSFGLKQTTNTYYNFDCPICGSKGKGSISFSQNKAKCWKGCFYGSIIDAVKIIEDKDYRETLSYIDTFSETSINIIEHSLPSSSKSSVVTLPYSYKNILEGSTSLAGRARDYLYNRNFDLDRLSEIGIGYCNEHAEKYEDDYFGYVIVPFKNRGVLKYFLGRSFLGNPRRYKNPNKEKVGVGKGDLFFNEDALDLYDETFLVEGWADATTLGDRAISSQGWSLSPYQKERIINSQVKTLTIIPDMNYYSKAIELATKFLDHKTVKVLNIDTLSEYGKDVNEIGKYRVLNLYERTKPLTLNHALEVLMD